MSQARSSEPDTALSVRGLTVDFVTASGPLRAVDSVDLHVPPRSVLAIVGESGSGKTTVAHAIARILPEGSARVAGGQVWLRGRDLLRVPAEEMWRVRGREVALVFQEPMSSLNPVYTVGHQIVEAIRQHERVTRRIARERAAGLLRRVGISDEWRRLDAYPHQLSGGLRQRVVIAMALASGPSLLIADEPTTSLDVTVQAQVLDLLLALKDEYAMSIVLITHDLGIVAQTADDVVVMYAGRVVERGPVGRVFARPRHPYTRGLLACVPRLSSFAAPVPPRLAAIEGVVASGLERSRGCAFASRCPSAVDRCRLESPPPKQWAPGDEAACFLAEEAAA